MKLPGTEGSAIQMDELCPGIIAHPAVLQLQRRLPDLPGPDAGDEEVDGLALHVQAVPGGTTASFHKKGIVFR